MASVQKRGERWIARVVLPGGREATKTWARKVDAWRWANEEQAKVDRGAWVDPKLGRESFGEYATRWLAAQPHRASTAQLYESALRLHITPVLGDRAIATLRRSDVQAWVTGLAGGGGLGTKTVENTYKLVRAIFASAVDDGLLAVSPCRRVLRAPVVRRQVVPLELARVLALAEAMPARFRALVLLAAGSGLREGECLGLSVDRVDFLRREIRVDAQLVQVTGTPVHLGPPKTDKSVRVVPVPGIVTDALARHLAAFEPVAVSVGLAAGADERRVLFANTRGKVVARNSLHRSWVAALAGAGLPVGTHFHDLRHTYASLLIEGGESVTVVAARLGHANARETLATYSHLWPDSEDRTRGVVEHAFAAAADSAGASSGGRMADSADGAGL